MCYLSRKVNNVESKEASDLEYLTWFWNNIDLGPAYRHAILDLEEMFEKGAGKKVPNDFSYKNDTE